MAEAKKNKKEVKDETVKKTNPEKIIKEEVAEKAAPKKLVKTAKAGKRSSKVQAEVIEKEVKEAKKAKASEEIINKVKQKPRVKKYSKNQKAARDLIEPTKLYTLKEALELLPKISKTNFDASAEIHVTLNIDPRQSDQIVRTTTSLPSGTGKSIKIAVIAQDEEAQLAKKAGADMVDADAIIKDISKEKINFDILIAAPDKMAELGKLAKVLGPKGLMPSPKNGTITADTAKATQEFKKGKVEIKNDANGVVHVAFGKVSFKTED
ncbi:MAG: 50S ribosomal protein L1, partial [Patescibacteria group bacterium]|nr:50S ribosomal protein L1 [Patescibacteria group bacterium]